jgi:predicted negative regulator of RcsB-dependent stress response
MLVQADLARFAGQFVWLELNFDNEANGAFLAQYGAYATPTFYIIDSQDGNVAASQTGAMSLVELKQFLDRGLRGVSSKKQTRADIALVRGDTVLAKRPEEAVADYKEALQLAQVSWSQREVAQASLVTALQSSGHYQECAETAAIAARDMSRGPSFARTIVAGMWCLHSDDPAPWTKATAVNLEPLANEALSLHSTVRDHRNELYRTLMYLALSRENKKKAAVLGDRWLAELDGIKPKNSEERTAVDIARVESVQVFGDPRRILPALQASEREMPTNWNASLRVAQMESQEGNFVEAIAATDRGLARRPGPAGKSWLLRVKADALVETGRKTEARRALEEALVAAKTIPNEGSRENNIRALQRSIEALAAGK